MTQPDLIQMLINLSKSMALVESALAQLLFVMGLCVLMDGILSLSSFGAGRHGGNDQQFTAVVKIVVGTMFIYSKTGLEVLNVTFFGHDALLSYMPIKPIDEYTAVKAIMQVVGLVWFARGAMMGVHASEPGPSGFKKPFLPFVYMFAGIAAINFDFSVGALDFVLTSIRQFFAGSTITIPYQSS